MFQFRRFPSYTYVFSVWWLDMTPAGLLHSEIHGSMPTYGSPWLIAVSRVLLRLPVPRHSPCALCSLTMCFEMVLSVNCSCYPKNYFLGFYLNFAVFIVQFSRYKEHKTFHVLCSPNWTKFSLLLGSLRCWWAQVDSNHRPYAYQAYALTTWAMSP